MLLRVILAALALAGAAAIAAGATGPGYLYHGSPTASQGPTYFLHG
jgi:hypothetical protein